MRKCNQNFNRLILFLITFVVAVMARPLWSAQPTYATWSGLGASNNLWSNIGNWVDNNVPASNNNTAVILTGSTQTTNVLNLGSFSLNSLTFASEAGPFTINQVSGDFFNFFSTTTSGVLPHIDQFSAANQAINFPNTGFMLNSDLLLGGTGTGSLSIGGQLQGAGRVILNAPYTVSFSASVAYVHAGMTINNGIMRLSSDVALGNGSLNFGGGTLQLINILTLTRPIVLNAGGGAIDVNGFVASMPNAALTISGPGRLTLTNSSGAGTTNIAGQLQQSGGLAITGNNTVTLSGTNTYTGGTAISGGATLTIDSDGRLGNPASALTLDGGTLRFIGTGGYNLNRGITLNAGGGAFDIGAATNPIGLNAAIGGIGGLIKSGTGRIGLIQANTYTGTTTVTGGSLDVVHNQAVQNSTVNLNGGTLGFFSPASAPILGGLGGSSNVAFNGVPSSLTVGNNSSSNTYSGGLSGGLANGLNKIGTGTWTLAGSNTQTGPFNIQSGVVVAASAGALSPNAPISLFSGAVLDLNGFNYAPLSGTSTLAGAVQMRFGAIVANTGVTVAYDGATVSNGFLSGGGQQVFNGLNTLNNITTFNGAQLTQSGTLNLNNSTMGGALNIGGTLNWTNGTLTSSGNLTVADTANFTGVTSNGRVNLSGGANTGTLNVWARPLVLGGGSTTFVGSVSEPGGTINLNDQSLDLNGALLVNNGKVINGTTNVGYGSLAKGAGTYGAVNITDGGKFSPGNSPGSVTTGSATWNSGGSYIVEIADGLSDAGHDFWLVDGELNLTASASHPFAISLESVDGLIFDPTRDYTWPILRASAGLSGFDPSEIAMDTSAFKNSLDGGHFTLESSDKELSVHFLAVPEPSVALLVIATVSWANFRRRSNLLVRRLTC